MALYQHNHNWGSRDITLLKKNLLIILLYKCMIPFSVYCSIVFSCGSCWWSDHCEQRAQIIQSKVKRKICTLTLWFTLLYCIWFLLRCPLPVFCMCRIHWENYSHDSFCFMVLGVVTHNVIYSQGCLKGVLVFICPCLVIQSCFINIGPGNLQEKKQVMDKEHTDKMFWLQTECCFGWLLTTDSVHFLRLCLHKVEAFIWTAIERPSHMIHNREMAYPNIYIRWSWSLYSNVWTVVFVF